MNQQIFRNALLFKSVSWLCTPSVLSSTLTMIHWLVAWPTDCFIGKSTACWWRVWLVTFDWMVDLIMSPHLFSSKGHDFDFMSFSCSLCFLLCVTLSHTHTHTHTNWHRHVVRRRYRVPTGFHVSGEVAWIPRSRLRAVRPVACGKRPVRGRPAWYEIATIDLASSFCQTAGVPTSLVG